jgi:hypothetical protein
VQDETISGARMNQTALIVFLNKDKQRGGRAGFSRHSHV